MALINNILIALKTDTGASRLSKADAEEQAKHARETIQQAQKLINENPLNKDPQKLEEDVKRAVLAAERMGGTDADKRRYAVDMLSDMGYDTARALVQDGTQYGDLIAHSIDTQVLALNLGIYEIERGLKRLAENSEEFKVKYGRKRFNSSTAGRSIIYAYSYWAYLRKEDENLSNADLLAHPLYKDMNAIRAKVNTMEDARLYNQYLLLEAWLGEAFEAALFMRNGLRSVLAHFYSIASGAIAGEELRDALGAQADEDKVALWLSLLSVDNLRPTSSTHEAALTLRQNIENGLQYLNVYNTLITIIAPAVDVPELVVFKMNMQPVNELIGDLNEALGLLRAAIDKRETVPDEQSLTTAPPLFTESAKRATLEAFRDVSPDAPPIPEENIRETKRYLRDNILHGTRAWQNLFPQLSKNYWWRIAR